MGLHEDDRIRSKNRRFNFPTPDINQAARSYIESTGLEGKALISELQSKLENNDDACTREVIGTAIVIATTERK